MDLNLTHHQDPAHGWIEAPRALVDSLGIASRVSAYSYESEGVCYLEEDHDGLLLIEAARAQGHSVTITTQHTEGDSFVRDLPEFRP